MITLDFVGIGALKAGTTWLAACMADHPQLCLSRPKELNFFSDVSFFPEMGSNFNAPEKWLAQRFAHAQSGQLKGEFSPNYMLDPAVPKRLLAHNPNLKILVSYREPTDRLYSLYHQFRKEYPVPDTFETYLDSCPHFLESGLYARQTRTLLEVFPRKQVHFLLYDDIVANPEGVLRNLFTFLGVEPGVHSPRVQARINERAAPRSLWVRDTINAARVLLNRAPATRMIKRGLVAIGLEHLMHRAQAANLHKAQLPPIAPDTAQRLRAFYYPDVIDLQGVIERDLSGWLIIKKAG